MATKKRGLGRGLNALLGGSETVEAMVTPQRGDELKDVDVDLIQRGPWQPRTHFDEEALQELADSISTQGVVQPIVLRVAAGGRYEIVAGERRWRASQLAGLDKVPAVIKHFDDQTAAAVSLIENIQRENLNPLEESTALLRLMNDFEMTHQEIADSVGRSRASVSNLLRLQDLNADVKELLSCRDIEMGHARALLGITGNAQSTLARQVAKKGLSVRETEQLVRRALNPAVKPKPVRKDPDISKLETDLSECLGASVHIKQKAKGKGAIEISYNSLDELEGILAKIQ
ncbi:MAG: ParB/RepB/Spo0J family partition protein [Gammaproteobacteria bacterium]|nr:ParB/RepB/Spo0J family partition protein [Gammaproteobacteria bacterium]